MNSGRGVGCPGVYPAVAEPDLQVYGVASGHRDHARYLGERSGFGL